MSTAPLLRVRGLKKHFPVGEWKIKGLAETVKAVDGIAFDMHHGETLGIVGESGCGKSTVARLVLRLIPETEGRVIFEGQDVFALNRRRLRRLRKKMQIVFQDPFSSLDPRKTIRNIIGEPLNVHRVGTRREREKRVQELMERVGISSQWASRYPHEFSGGQRQRVVVARALALNPSLIICDEPVSALDVSIQAQVLNLLKNLQKEFGLTYLFISHDLSVVKHISKNIAVMYLGKIIELAANDDLFDEPLHPYTQALLSALPVPDPKRIKKRVLLKGDVPNPIDPPAGCRFHTRCPVAMPRCSQEEPVFRRVGADRMVACHLVSR